jgi:hypothetical protein
MSRQPTPPLVKLLVAHRPLAAMAIGKVRLDDLPQEIWKSFDRRKIDADLAALIAQVGTAALVRDVAKPTVVCLFGDGMTGKSTVAYLLEQQGVNVFATDGFFAQLLTGWHGNAELLAMAQRHTTQHIDQFLAEIQQNPSLASEYVRLFFDQVHGFNCNEPLSVIEGMVSHPHFPRPYRIDREIRKGLHSRGYRVWTTSPYDPAKD